MSRLDDDQSASIFAAEEEEAAARKKLVRDKHGQLRQADLTYEFDCPECDANNPWDDGFKEGDAVRCHYCGQELKAMTITGTKVKFRLE